MIKIVAFVAVVLCLAFQRSEGALGFNGGGPYSSSHMTCLKNAGYTFFIGRIYMINGQVDAAGIQNIVNARNAGFYDIDGYIAPCLSSSCPSAVNQVTAAINALQQAGAYIGRLWIEVDTQHATSMWPPSVSKNQAFIEAMVSTASSQSYSVGIITNYNFWQSIVGANYNGVSYYPLWWINYNGVADVSTGWSPFGGWYSPTVHLYVNAASLCGAVINKDFK